MRDVRFMAPLVATAAFYSALLRVDVRSLAQQVRGAACPDTPPQELPPSAALSMCAGDFLEVYREQQSCWEAIAPARPGSTPIT